MNQKHGLDGKFLTSDKKQTVLERYVVQATWRTENKQRVNGYYAKYRKNNPGKVKQSHKNRLLQFHELVDNLKLKPCMDCAEQFPPCAMDFDHRPGENKIAGIGQMQHWKPSRIIEEIAKCDLICANCHRIRTYDRIQNAHN